MNTARSQKTVMNSGALNQAQVCLPERFSLENLFNFALELQELKNKKAISIDLGKKRYFPPFVMLFVAASIRSFNRANTQCRTFIRNYEDHSYLAHMGFFDLCGVKFGKQMGEASGNDDHIPITVVTREQFYESSVDKYSELQDLIQRHANRIAEIITRGDAAKKDLFDILSYSVREAIRNVFEHSGANEVYYCGQYWPTSNKVEVSVADLGMGIRLGLGTNPNFRYESDKQAIEASLLPGVSGKTHLPRRSENWFNSGYGLYMTNRLARNGGNFVIASGDAAIHLTHKTKNNYVTHFDGTAIRLNFDIIKTGDVMKRLEEFREDAKKISNEFFGSKARRPPSAMSLLLRRDYR